MKQVFNSGEVPHIWAQQSQKAGRNQQGNIYFEGATIFSYGSHFPIATIEGNDVLFTLRTYSNTTAKHISKVYRAVSDKNIIYCFEAPVKWNDKPLKKQELFSTHENNMNYWKREIKQMVDELGNKRNRDVGGRMNVISRNVDQLNKYVAYFGLKIKDTELKSLLSIVSAPDFIEQAREAKAKADAANEKKLKAAAKAYNLYIDLWRKYDNEGIKDLPQKTKDLCNFYVNRKEAFTRLRFNTEANRLETSKGVQIPAEIAKRAYIQLNGCMEGTCKDISVPVMQYEITETTDKYIKAGCHTIPKEDIRYIAELLKW